MIGFTRKDEKEKIISKSIRPGAKLFFDMDRVLVNFDSGIEKLDPRIREQYEWGDLDEVPGIFGLMEPMEGAVEAVKKLSQKYDCYVLSTAPWNNTTSWEDKIKFIHKYFGQDKSSPFYKKVILSHHKDLCYSRDAYLIDDRIKNGSELWYKNNRLIHFGNEQFPDWDSVVKFLI